LLIQLHNIAGQKKALADHYSLFSRLKCLSTTGKSS